MVDALAILDTNEILEFNKKMLDTLGSIKREKLNEIHFYSLLTMPVLLMLELLDDL